MCVNGVSIAGKPRSRRLLVCIRLARLRSEGNSPAAEYHHSPAHARDAMTERVLHRRTHWQRNQRESRHRGSSSVHPSGAQLACPVTSPGRSHGRWQASGSSPCRPTLDIEGGGGARHKALPATAAAAPRKALLQALLQTPATAALRADSAASVLSSSRALLRRRPAVRLREPVRNAHSKATCADEQHYKGMGLGKLSLVI